MVGSSKEFLILETAANLCSAEAQVNGIPLCRLTPETTLLDSRPVHQYLLPEANTFTLVVEPGPVPSLALAPAAEPMKAQGKTAAALRLMSMPRGSFPEDPGVRELFRMDWTPEPGKPVAVPVVLERKFEAPLGGRRWSWLDGDSLEDPAALDAVAALLVRLRDGFMHGDPEPFIQNAGVRFHEASAAYSLDPAAQVDHFREEFRSISAEPGFEWQPLDREQFDLRVCAGGKIVDCVDKSWQPLLRSVKLPNGSTRMRYPVKMARLGGRIQIVR